MECGLRLEDGNMIFEYDNSAALVNRANSALNALANLEGAYLLVRNPDGTNLTIQPDCEVVFVRLQCVDEEVANYDR